MKKLYVVRHAKSSWKLADQLKDYQRPLAKKGYKQCDELERVFRNIDNEGVIVTSYATRAMETSLAIQSGCGASIRVDRFLYDMHGTTNGAAIGRLLEIIRDEFTFRDTLILVGHNPVLNSLVRMLGGYYWDEADASWFDEGEIWIKTGKVLCFEYPDVASVGKTESKPISIISN
ncbi:hypothetical protein GR7B_00201 [Vibrio phage vB_VcorM_GR7B]|nr:hypothetical protein GR7B_00201 [Vibrio phage vB_VcorM_GR7B]